MAKTKMRGKRFNLYLELDGDLTTPTWVLAGCATDCTLDLTTSELSDECKDDDDWEDSEPNTRSWAVALPGLVTFDDVADALNVDVFFDLHLSKDIIGLKIVSDEATAKEFIGLAYLTSFNLATPVAGRSTYNSNFKGKKAYSYAVPPTP